MEIQVLFGPQIDKCPSKYEIRRMIDFMKEVSTQYSLDFLEKPSNSDMSELGFFIYSDFPEWICVDSRLKPLFEKTEGVKISLNFKS